jgi:hypothetical protein
MLNAPDLTKAAPRSPQAPLGLFGALAARIVDKCRAEIAGTSGGYHYNCSLDQQFFRFTKIDPTALKAFVATGASDPEIGAWLEEHSAVRDPSRIRSWSLFYKLNPFLRLLDLDDWFHTRRAGTKNSP